MSEQYQPPAPGTPPEKWTDDQWFKYEWIGQTVAEEMYDNPEYDGLSEEALDEIWRKYVDWYFWGNRKIPGHEGTYD